MKKRKIFYFLKTKEEYDYMLASGLIPKRGIVLIESTQEIYKNKVPYSGYGPLKPYFESLRTDLQSFIQDRTQAMNESLQNTNNVIHEDLESYNNQFQTQIDAQAEQIGLVKKDLSNSTYYINNTIVPSLNNFETQISNLRTTLSQTSSLLTTKVDEIAGIKSSLQIMMTNLENLSKKHTTDISELQDYVSRAVSNTSSSSSSYNEENLKNWVKNYVNSTKLSDSELTAKISSLIDSSTYDVKLNALESKLQGDINTKYNDVIVRIQNIWSTIQTIQTQTPQTSQTETSSETPTQTNYVLSDTDKQWVNTSIDSKISTTVENLKTNYIDIKTAKATTTSLGVVMVGDYLTINNITGKLSVNFNSIKTAILAEIPNNSAQEQESSQQGSGTSQQGGGSTPQGGDSEPIPDISGIVEDEDLAGDIITNWQRVKRAAVVNDETVRQTVGIVMDDYVDILTKIKNGTIDWYDIFSDEGWKTIFENYLVEKEILHRNLDLSVTPAWKTYIDGSALVQGFTGIKNGIRFVNGLCVEDNSDQILDV